MGLVMNLVANTSVFWNSMSTINDMPFYFAQTNIYINSTWSWGGYVLLTFNSTWLMSWKICWTFETFQKDALAGISYALTFWQGYCKQTDNINWWFHTRFYLWFGEISRLWSGSSSLAGFGQRQESSLSQYAKIFTISSRQSSLSQYAKIFTTISSWQSEV